MKAKNAKKSRGLSSWCALTLGTIVLMVIVTVVVAVVSCRLLYTQAMMFYYRGSIANAEKQRDYYHEMAISYPLANYQASADEYDAEIPVLEAKLQEFKDSAADPITIWAFRSERDIFTVFLGFFLFVLLGFAWWLINKFSTPVIRFEFRVFQFIFYWFGTIGAFLLSRLYLLCNSLRIHNQRQVKPIFILKSHMPKRKKHRRATKQYHTSNTAVYSKNEAG